MSEAQAKKPALEKAAVIGYPVAQSLSPLIHNHWIARYGLAARYEALAIAPPDLAARVRDMAAQGYAGFNITVPHKVAVKDLCNEVDDRAQQIGAVNTVTVQQNGALFGTNTDAFGFAENLRQQGGADNLAGRAALVLGAGGAARAVVYALKDMGLADIRIANRTKNKAAALADAFAARPVDWDRRTEEAGDVALVVNTTVLGMDGQAPLDFDVEKTAPGAVICDIVYKPRETILLRDARVQGRKAVDGLGMLLHQARPAFESWFGILPDVDDGLQQKLAQQVQG